MPLKGTDFLDIQAMEQNMKFHQGKKKLSSFFKKLPASIFLFLVIFKHFNKFKGMNYLKKDH